jgi:hypothetical protein
LDLFAASGGRRATLNDPALICYYLFFPGHDDGLAGCVGVPEAREYASFAGEWACVAVVLDRPATSPDYAPKWVGLTNRNIGSSLGTQPTARMFVCRSPKAAMRSTCRAKCRITLRRLRQ